MNNNRNAFSEWKSTGQYRIENDSKGHDSDRKERSMPCLGDVVFVVDDDEPLYDGSDHETHTGQERVVADSAQPAGAVAQESLVFGRSEL